MIGDVVRRLREARGWSQVELARRVGIEPAQVSRLEASKSKNPTQRTLQKLARAFDMPVGDFMDLAGMGAPIQQMRAAGASEAELEELQRIWPMLSKPFKAGVLASARAWLEATEQGEPGAKIVANDDPQADQVTADRRHEGSAVPAHILGNGPAPAGKKHSA